MKFSTYVDDMVVSSKMDFKSLIPDFLKIITDDGFIISHRKTNYKTKNPEVTGVVVKNNNLALSNKTKTKLKDETLSEASKKGHLLYVEKIKMISGQKIKSLLKPSFHER
jgi:RNA-directed DNA polymerase